MQEQNESPIKFPCDFVIKIFGKANKKFEPAVTKILKKFVPNFKGNYVRRYSRDNNYLALTINIHAVSKEQLDNIYQALHNTKEIIMLL